VKKLLWLAFLLALPMLLFAAEPCIKHTFQSAKAQGSDPTLIGPNEWNACHSEPPKIIQWGIGCTKAACAVLEDGDDYPKFLFNYSERTWTITKVLCRSDAGGPMIQLQRDDGSPVNMFSSNMTCNSTPSGTDGTDGILTSFVSGENVISPEHYLSFVMVSAGGTAKAIDITIQFTTSP
jgi:hypothetical protein